LLQVTREIVTDVINRSTSKVVTAKQNDAHSRFLNVRIQEGGKSIDIDPAAMVMLNVQRPDGSAGTFYGSVNDDGTVKVELSSWILEQAGTISCDVSLVVDESAKLTTMTFYIEVEPAVFCDEDIEETDEYNIIVDLLNRTQEAEKQASEAAAQATMLKENCEQATKQANSATNKANAAADKANAAADNANAVKEGVEAGGYIESLKELNNGSKFSTWVGTSEEYAALPYKIPNCLYLITDDPVLQQMRQDIEQNKVTVTTDHRKYYVEQWANGTLKAKGKYTFKGSFPNEYGSAYYSTAQSVPLSEIFNPSVPNILTSIFGVTAHADTNLLLGVNVAIYTTERVLFYIYSHVKWEHEIEVTIDFDLLGTWGVAE
jgi:hypothetical protein